MSFLNKHAVNRCYVHYEYFGPLKRINEQNIEISENNKNFIR